jgi:hypothetical protein
MDDLAVITIVTLIIGFMGLSVKMCLASKCDTVELLGCLKIHRNTDQEVRDPIENEPENKNVDNII